MVKDWVTKQPWEKDTCDVASHTHLSNQPPVIADVSKMVPAEPSHCLCDPLKGIKWTRKCPIHGIADRPIPADLETRISNVLCDMYGHSASETTERLIAAMGDASTRKDEELTSQLGFPSPAKVCSNCDTSGRCTYVCDQPNATKAEVDEVVIANRIANIIHTYVCSRDLDSLELTGRATKKILDFIQPYLRTISAPAPADQRCEIADNDIDAANAIHCMNITSYNGCITIPDALRIIEVVRPYLRQPVREYTPAPADVVERVEKAMQSVVDDPTTANSRDFHRHWEALRTKLAKAAIAAMTPPVREYGQWIDVKERLPEIDQAVLAASNQIRYPIPASIAFIKDGSPCWRLWPCTAQLLPDKLYRNCITHWQPMPNMPPINDVEVEESK